MAAGNGRKRTLGRARVSAAVALMLGLTAACGSTTAGRPRDTRPAGTSESRTTLGDQPIPQTQSTSLVPAGPTSDLSPSGGEGTHSTGAQAPSSYDPASVSGAARSAALNGPGVTGSTITFGVTYTLDAGQAQSSAGADNVDAGDVRMYYNALVDEVNRSGGVAGRHLVADYYETKTTSAESADSQRNAACEHWTSDVKAFVFLDAVSEVARSCAEKHGMLSISGGGNAVERTFTLYPHYLEPSGIALERYEAATVSGLAETDYYGKSPVIGIVTWDDPNFRKAVSSGMLPELARLGRKPKVISYISVPESYAGAGSTSASINSAILKFKQEEVTHVFVVDGPAGVCTGTCMTLLWIKAAASQSYYPKYGFNDLNSPQDALDAKLWGPDDVRGSRYVTAINNTDATDVGVGKNPSRVACLALMKRHGMVPGNSNASASMLHACDNIWFLRAVLGTARAAVNRDRFVALTEALGSSYRSPTVYRNKLSPTRHGGLNGYRRMTFDDASGRYRYISGIYSP